MIDAAALEGPKLFYATAGGRFTFGVPIAVELDVPNPLGGQTLAAQGRFVLGAVKPAEARAVIDYRATFDPHAFMAALHDFVERMFQRQGRQLPDLYKFPTPSIEDTAHYVVDTATGRPISVDYLRTIVIGDRRRTEHSVIRVLPDDAAAAGTAARAGEPKPGKARAHYRCGRLFNMVGEHARAVEEFDKAIALDPGRTLAYVGRGSAYTGLGEIDRAIADFDHAISLDPRNAAAYDGRGSAYFHAVKWRRAIEDFNQAIHLDPNDALSYFHRSGAQRAIGDTDREIGDLDRAIALSPGFAPAHLNRGHAYQGLGNYARAIEDYNESLPLVPTLVPAYVSRGYAYDALGDHPRAIDDFNRVIRDDPNNGSAYYGRARALCRTGHAEKSFGDHLRAMRLGALTKRKMQRMLRIRGFYDGAVDGDFGAGSQRAMRDWIAAGCPEHSVRSK